MRKIRDTTTTPPGGWLYIEPSTGVEFRNLSYQAVIGQARTHRQAMGLPVGADWLDEAQEIMIGLNPKIEWFDTKKPERRFTSDDVVRFLKVMNELRGKGLVSEEEQSRRASICVKCPKIRVIPCQFCGWVSQQITGYIAGRQVAHKNEIFKKACGGCGCDLTAKTAIPMDVLKKADEGRPVEYAEGCWMITSPDAS